MSAPPRVTPRPAEVGSTRRNLQRVFGAGHYLRPQFVQPYRCTNVLIEGVRLINSPMWQVHPVLCTNVTVKDLSIQAAGPNTDSRRLRTGPTSSRAC